LHPHCFNVAIRKIASAEENRLETDVRSASSDMDAVDGHGVLQGTVPILVRYDLRFSFFCIRVDSAIGLWLLSLAHKSVNIYYYRCHQLLLWWWS
jgi:hypothetical protein